MQGRILFFFFFLYIILQGAIRKWGFPGLGNVLYLLQYVFLVFFYFSNKEDRYEKNFTIRPGFHDMVMIFAAYCFLEVMNIRGTTNLIVQIYGLTMNLIFIPLAYFIPKILSDEKEYDSQLKKLLIIVIPIFILGTIQFYSPQDSFINKYAIDENSANNMDVALGSGGKVRITGTFSYLSTYASFLCFILHVLFSTLLVSLIKLKFNIIVLAAYGLGFVNLFMTGSRGPTGYYIITEGLTIGLMAFSGQIKFLKNLFPLFIVLGVSGLIIMNSDVGSTAINDFTNRVTESNDLDGRITDSFAPLKFAEECGAVGFGIGTAQAPVGQYLTNRGDMPGYWEEEGERIVIEMGLLGYVLTMAFRGAVFYSCFMTYKRIKRVEYKLLALQMTMYQLPFLINLQSNMFNYIDGMFYWIAVGLVYFAYHMELQFKDSELKSSADIVPAFKWN